MISGIVNDTSTATNRGLIVVAAGAGLSFERVHFRNEAPGTIVAGGSLTVGGPVSKTLVNAGVLTNLGLISSAITITNAATGFMASDNHLRNAGRLRLLNGTTAIDGTLLCEPGSTLTAESGARLELAGDFSNRIAASSSFDLTSAAVAFNSPLAVTQKYEVAGANIGATTTGLRNNFGLDRLIVNGSASNTLSLVNEYGAGSALYVRTVELGAGCRLAIGDDITLYYLTFVGNRADVVLGANAYCVPVKHTGAMLFVY